MKGSIYFLLAILLIMLGATYLAIRMPEFSSKLLPLSLSVAITVLAGARILIEIRHKKTENVEKAQADTEPENVRTLLMTATWLLGFFLIIYLFGFTVAIPLFVAGYLRFRGRGWTRSVVSGLGMAALIYVVFVLLMGVRMYQGVLHLPV